MIYDPDAIGSDPQLDASLRQLAAADNLTLDQDRRVRARLGLPLLASRDDLKLAESPLDTRSITIPASTTGREITSMTTQARASRRRQWLEVVAGSIAIILVAVILVAVFQPPDDTPELLPGTVASPAANRASASSTGVGGTATNASRLPLSATSAGFVVTLSRAEIMTGRASGAPMTLTFHVEDIDPISPPSTRQYAPPLPADFELEGLVWAGEFTGSVRPTSDRENPVIELELEFRLEGDPSTPVEVRITTLRFTPKAGDNEPTAIEGTWTFTFVPRDIAIDDVE